ncbi:MFS transporter [Listeria cossartiae subsp. cayugensis]|uniref:MFS transporter n=1 Tax=Listeria cossartiae subsp. cayugensis TaxID=2713505 RepID=A0ABU2IMK0_9LIST|nr:MFS transporter [Listeria cossartiae]MDT0049397.1 MFS transporter [Listeria cossartiae subsp. cayugensis]MDT0065900.1 MFS transporter [Listeria cossartiae subsp. cayugensis]MDT0078496.1 MFS transporter [Listeria cossartiae subsp. cayugensis]MDT0081332.1 MFS transporter [Listeria cossartiae subsp. cayugensis]MDT0088133.1 MFS transporter [Listeria cossartiae subsp. cayugensis]
MLKNKNFRYLWLGRLISNAGDSMYYIVLSWYILTLTNDSFWVGIVNFAIFVPNIFAFLFGHWIDTHSKKSALILCEFGQLFAIALMVLSIFSDFQSPMLLCILAFVASIFGMNTYTIQDAMTPYLVKKEQLANAQSYMSVAYNGTEYLFNALTGFLINIFSTITLLIANIITFLFAIFSFSKIKEPTDVNNNEQESFLKNVFTGFVELFQNKTILFIAIGGGMANFMFGGLNVYQVLIAKEQGSAIVLGLLTSTMAIGTLIGSTLLATLLLKFMKIGKVLTLCTLLFGLTMLISSYFVNSPLIIFIWGFASTFLGATHVVQKPFFQVLIQKERLGKVFSALYSLSVATLPIGALLFGYFSSHNLNSSTFLLIFGGTYLLISFIYFLNKHIFKFTISDNI